MEQMVWIKTGLSLEFGATLPNQRVHLKTRFTGFEGDEVFGFGSGLGGVYPLEVLGRKGAALGLRFELRVTSNDPEWLEQFVALVEGA